LSNGSEKDFYIYDTIPLRVFFEILRTGDLKLLILSHNHTQYKIIEAEIVWDEILRRNGQESGNLDFNNYIDHLRTYAYLISEFVLIKACLSKLTIIPVDVEAVETLTKKGYVIDLTTSKTFLDSVRRATTKSNNLVTKIAAKQKELEKMGRSEGKPLTFAKALANISKQLKFSVDRNLTLAEYNEYVKLLKENNGRVI